jgi:hypothetical protein
MDIALIRQLFKQGYFNVYFHAFEEALKDGITGDDIVYVVEHGEIIEEYPERSRCLLFATTPAKVPMHIVVDYSCRDELQIVTTYIPNQREWIAFRKRRK